jgi:hypothetical protein
MSTHRQVLFQHAGRIENDFHLLVKFEKDLCCKWQKQAYAKNITSTRFRVQRAVDFGKYLHSRGIQPTLLPKNSFPTYLVRCAPDRENLGLYVLGRQHLLVQYPYYQNPIWLEEIEHNMPAYLESSQTSVDCVAGTAKGGIARQKIEAIFQFREVPVRLPPSPCSGRIGDNAVDILFGRR